MTYYSVQLKISIQYTLKPLNKFEKEKKIELFSLLFQRDLKEYFFKVIFIYKNLPKLIVNDIQNILNVTKLKRKQTIPLDFKNCNKLHINLLF